MAYAHCTFTLFLAQAKITTFLTRQWKSLSPGRLPFAIPRMGPSKRFFGTTTLPCPGAFAHFPYGRDFPWGLTELLRP